MSLATIWILDANHSFNDESYYARWSHIEEIGKSKYACDYMCLWVDMCLVVVIAYIRLWNVGFVVVKRLYSQKVESAKRDQIYGQFVAFGLTLLRSEVAYSSSSSQQPCYNRKFSLACHLSERKLRIQKARLIYLSMIYSGK